MFYPAYILGYFSPVIVNKQILCVREQSYPLPEDVFAHSRLKKELHLHQRALFILCVQHE